jgi:hypothetical protein
MPVLDAWELSRVGPHVNNPVGRGLPSERTDVRTSLCLGSGRRDAPGTLRASCGVLFEPRGYLGSQAETCCRFYGVGAPSAFVIFDTVPGGAGHAQRVGREIADIARAALERVEQCECGPETSCYQCLRSYQNQTWHEELSRGSASGTLRGLLGLGH